MLAISMLLAWLAAPALATPLCFDRVLLKDGRTIECTLIDSPDPAFVRIKVESVEIPIRADLVDKSWVENLENYVPKNAQEEEYLKKGFVLFEGSWMSSKRREGELKKRADADKDYIVQQKKRQDWRNAVTVETRHFTVKSNLETAILERFTDNLEAYYKNFVEFWGITIKPGDLEGKPKIFLYRTKPDFHRVTGMPYFVGGFFSPVTFELHLYYNADDPEESFDVLFHEGNHMLTQLINTRFLYPIWLNEGMAEYYGTAEIDAKGNFIVGAQQDGRIVAMRRDKENGEFLRMRDVLLTRREDGFNATHYAYSWSFVHFMMQSPKYGSAFKAFFKTLPENRDLEIERAVAGEFQGGTVGIVELEDVLDALERRMGKSIEELETEWLAFFDTAYGEMKPTAYYTAAQFALFMPGEDGPDIKAVVAYYEKAVELGIQDADCYRDFAELLRKGGVREGDEIDTPLKPDQVRAWEMIQKAIELDPIGPNNYCEAAGILIMDGPKQDLDKASDYAATALALAGPRDWGTKALYDELMSLIEPARAKRESKAEAEAEAAKADNRKWHVAFYFITGQEAPPNLADLSTEELRELIRSGKVTGRDNVFQSWQAPDPETGNPVAGDNPWDKDWVKVRDVPLFAEELATASAPAPAGGGESGEDPAAKPAEPANDPPANPEPPSDGED